MTSPTILTGTLSILNTVNPGTYDATVYQGPGCTGTEYDCFSCFTVTAAPSVISTINPNVAQVGQFLDDVQFIGSNTNFTSNTTCVEILANATITLTDINVTSTTELTADLAVDPISINPGVYDARIYEGPDCTGTDYTCSACFTIGQPDVSYSPNIGNAGSTFGITIIGDGPLFSNLTDVAEILASPSTITLTGITFISSSQLTAIVTIPPGTTPGDYDIRVYAGPGASGAIFTCTDCFRVLALLPVEWARFEGWAEEQQSILEWTTAK